MFHAHVKNLLIIRGLNQYMNRHSYLFKQHDLRGGLIFYLYSAPPERGNCLHDSFHEVLRRGEMENAEDENSLFVFFVMLCVLRVQKPGHKAHKASRRTQSTAAREKNLKNPHTPSLPLPSSPPWFPISPHPRRSKDFLTATPGPQAFPSLSNP